MAAMLQDLGRRGNIDMLSSAQDGEPGGFVYSIHTTQLIVLWPRCQLPRQCRQSHRYTYHACLPRVVRYSDIKGLSLLDSTRVYPIYTNYYRDSSTRVTLPSQHHRNHSDACACLMHDSVRDSFVWRLNRTAGANQAACCHHHYRAVAAAASKRRLIVFWGSKYYYYYILGYYIILGY